MRVAFVTTVDLSAIHDDVDLPLQTAAFAEAGIDLVHAAWEDTSVDWNAFDLVVVRSPWNYVEHLEMFRSWLAARRTMTRFHNPVGLIEWNMDKRYLVELSQHSVPVVPTVFVDSIEDFQAAIEAINAAEIVVKPTVSAGSRLTGRFGRTDAAATALAATILDGGLTVMVQPFALRIETEGEIGTVVFDGEISHSFRKAALLAENGELVGGAYQEEICGADAPDDVRLVVQAAANASTKLARERGWLEPEEELLYGRYDVIRLDDGTPALLEAELFEPCFFLPTDLDAVGRFVEAVERRIRD